MTKRLGLIIFLLTISAAIILTGCGGSKNATKNVPQERNYGIVNPNPDFEGLSKEERHNKIMERLSEITDGVFSELPIPDGYEIVRVDVEHSLNVHTNPNTAEITRVHLEFGKLQNGYNVKGTEQELIRHYNTQNRFLWVYGPYETVSDNVVLTLEYNNPLTRRHLDPMSYNFPVKVEEVEDGKHVLIFKELVTRTNERFNNNVHAWAGMEQHRFRLLIKENSEAEKDFDAIEFVRATMELY